nr:hypothetical protein [Endozoicomonas sp.]
MSRAASGKFYASILVDSGQATPKPIADLEESKIVGVDMGITDLAITSEGHKTGNPQLEGFMPL